MVSVALKVSEQFKSTMEKLPWVNWSELAREETIKEEQASKDFEEFKRIVSKSKFTEKDADELAEKVKSSMHKRLKAEGLV